MAGEYILIAACTDNLNEAQMFAGAFGYVGPNPKDKFLVLRTEPPQLQRKYEDVGGGAFLIGEALPGTQENEAEWRIKQVTTVNTLYASVGAMEIVFADDTAGFTKKWSDRATYDYNIPS